VKQETAYSLARAQYAEIGLDTEQALGQLDKVALSLPCWQLDDVTGFEPKPRSLAGSGLAVTGGYPGRARNVEELRRDADKAFSLIPGRHRLNLHSIYGEFPGRVERDRFAPEHFAGWIDWARERGLGLDFNATLFAHQESQTGFTLSSYEEPVRRYWVEHVRACRKTSAHIGRALGLCCIHNLWIPDGQKDIPTDRFERRELLGRSLDEIYETSYPAGEMKDAVESKLWGIGSEAFVVGSHDFYSAYAHKHGLLLCLDTGHFHPTESVADKLSAILQFSSELLLHLSRGVRWDSDHVVLLEDPLRELAQEIVRIGLGRFHLALDFFDASLNRVGALVLGSRAVLQALLIALLEPKPDKADDNLSRLARLEQAKFLPWSAVWDEHCRRHDVPTGMKWLNDVRQYEREVHNRRK